MPASRRHSAWPRKKFYLSGIRGCAAGSVWQDAIITEDHDGTT
jgi:hypothetical protein